MSKILRADGMKKCIGCFTCMFVCASVNKMDHSLSKSAIRIKTKSGMQSDFVADVCVACTGEPACYQACPSGALQIREGGGVIFHQENCIGCKKCKDACIVSGVNFDEENKLLIICKQCGVCTLFCPHGCLRMEDR